MSGKYSVVMMVITSERITVRAIQTGGESISEVYGRLPDGKIDYIEGNFEDEAVLPDGLLEALMGLQNPALAVMENLTAIGEK
jgi:hypothetical protein